MAYAYDITITYTHTSTSAAKKYIEPYLYKVFASTKQNNLTLNHKSVKFRAFRNIPVSDYRNDVKLLMCNRKKNQKNIDDLINNYNSTLQKLTDKYAPLQCKTIPLRPHAPWYTSALRQEKRVRRRSESGCANDAGS